MFKTIMLLGAVAFPAVSVLAQSHTLSEDAAAFGARESVQRPALSLDGSTVLYLTPAAGRGTVAVTANLVTGKIVQVMATSGDPEQLRWCNYAGSKRAVCSISGNLKHGNDMVGFSRLVSVDVDGGGDVKLLGQTDSAYDAWLRQFDGAIIDWLPAKDGFVLMSREYVPEEGKMGSYMVRTKAGLGVDEINVANLRGDSVESPRKGVSAYMTDGAGNVRLMELPEFASTGQLTGQVRYSYRTQDSRDWQPLSASAQKDFEPLGIDRATNSLFVLKPKGGRKALYSISLDGSLAERLVAENPRVDVDDVVEFGKSRGIIGYTFAEEVRKVVYTDPQFASLSRSLGKALPSLPAIEFVDSSADGSKMLIFASSDSRPGRYFVFDKATRQLAEGMLARPELEGRTLAEVKPITTTAADGTAIPAYLTLPPGKDARNLPTVVLPHGGPAARDEWGFDWLPQFLAARGYAVLQPQYRGSAGFGNDWLNENAFKNWRLAISDISASARSLATQGIADPKRMAIMGWSYGGYAALQSAVTEPDLYKAVIAIAPVTDFNLAKQESDRFNTADLTYREIGSGPEIEAGSPLRHAGQIKVPVLLVHGTRDANVGVAQSQKMDAALRGAGKQSELIVFEGLDHQLDDAAARTQMLTRVGALLDRAIGH